MCSAFPRPQAHHVRRTHHARSAHHVPRQRNTSCTKKPLCFAQRLFCGAGDEIRTRYLHLGKVALCQMSYARIRRNVLYQGFSLCQEEIPQESLPVSLISPLADSLLPFCRKQPASPESPCIALLILYMFLLRDNSCDIEAPASNRFRWPPSARSPAWKQSPSCLRIVGFEYIRTDGSAASSDLVSYDSFVPGFELFYQIDDLHGEVHGQIGELILFHHWHLFAGIS